MNRSKSQDGCCVSPFWQPSLWLGFLWGFAEGTLFFIIPDIIVSWAALNGVKSGARTLGSVLAGSLVAGAVMYSWAIIQPETSRRAVATVPFVRASMFSQVERDYADKGATGMLMGPGSGIPYKVYAVLAPPICGLSWFLLMSIPARLERLVLSWILFTAVGWTFRHWLQKWQRTVPVLFLVFWLITYALYWTRI